MLRLFKIVSKCNINVSYTSVLSAFLKWHGLSVRKFKISIFRRKPTLNLEFIRQNYLIITYLNITQKLLSYTKNKYGYLLTLVVMFWNFTYF